MNDAPLLAYDAKIDSNELWMLSWEYDVLMQFDMLSMQLKKYYVIPREETQPYLHYMITLTKERVYILPYVNGDLFYVDREKNELNKVSMNIWKNENDKKITFSVSWNNKLWMFGLNRKGIVVYDEKSNNYWIENEDLTEDLYKKGIGCTAPLFNDAFYQDNSIVYATIHKSSFIVELNLENGKYIIHDLSVYGIDDIITLDKYDDLEQTFILTTFDGKEVIWNIKDGVEQVNNYGDFSTVQTQYAHILCDGSKKYCINWGDERIIVRNKKDNEYINTIVFEDISIKQNIQEVYKFGMIVKDGNDIYIQRRRDKYIYKLDCTNNRLIKMNYSIPIELKKRIMLECHKKGLVGGMYQESSDFDLHIMLNVMLSK